MKKRMLVLLLAVALCVALTGCVVTPGADTNTTLPSDPPTGNDSPEVTPLEPGVQADEAYGYGKFADVKIKDKFGKWPEEREDTYYDSTVGAWMTVYLSELDSAMGYVWTSNCRLVPVDFGYYSHNDVDYINTQFSRLKNIGVDFVSLDDTNGHWNGYGVIARNVDTVFETVSKLGDKAPKLVLATGMTVVWDGDEGQQEEVDYLYETYVRKYADTYFQWKGKPMLLFFNNPFKMWVDKEDRFTIRRATASVSYGSDVIAGEEGVWGWVSNVDQPAEAEVMLVQAGYDKYHQGGYSLAVYPREHGKRYIDSWLAAVKANPEAIMMLSWNDYSEETGIEAANWVEGEDPYLYEKIAEGYLALKHGCIDGFYYRAESSETVYRYSADTHSLTLIPADEVPAKTDEPVIVVPDDYFAWAGLTAA